MKLNNFINMIGGYTNPNMKIIIHTPWNRIEERLENIRNRIDDIADMNVLYFNIFDEKLYIEAGYREVVE